MLPMGARLPAKPSTVAIIAIARAETNGRGARAASMVNGLGNCVATAFIKEAGIFFFETMRLNQPVSNGHPWVGLGFFGGCGV